MIHVYDHERFVPQVCMLCITVRGLLLADRPDLVAQTSHDHTHVLFNRVCGCHWKLLQNPAQITSLAPLWAGASVYTIHYLKKNIIFKIVRSGMWSTMHTSTSKGQISIRQELLRAVIWPGHGIKYTDTIHKLAKKI